MAEVLVILEPPFLHHLLSAVYHEPDYQWLERSDWRPIPPFTDLGIIFLLFWVSCWISGFVCWEGMVV